MIWLLIALAAAIFTSLTTIFAKVGLKDVNSNFATAYRTLIVIACAIIMCLISGSLGQFSSLTGENILFLALSGVATGCSWICYYKALKLGDVNKVAPIDKSSFILSSILFIIFFFDETTKGGSPLAITMLIVSILLIGVGTFLMIDKKDPTAKVSNAWLVFAILSAVFAAVVSLFVKLGLRNIPSDLGTLIRTVIVFFFALAIVLVKRDYKGVGSIKGKSWLFLTLSGFATGGAWLCEYAALNMEGSNPVVVNSIGKLSILLTMAFCFFFLKEKFSKRSLLGLGLLTAGIVLVIIFC